MKTVTITIIGVFLSICQLVAQDNWGILFQTGSEDLDVINIKCPGNRWENTIAIFKADPSLNDAGRRAFVFDQQTRYNGVGNNVPDKINLLKSTEYIVIVYFRHDGGPWHPASIRYKITSSTDGNTFFCEGRDASGLNWPTETFELSHIGSTRYVNSTIIKDGNPNDDGNRVIYVP